VITEDAYVVLCYSLPQANTILNGSKQGYAMYVRTVLCTVCTDSVMRCMYGQCYALHVYILCVLAVMRLKKPLRLSAGRESELKYHSTWYIVRNKNGCRECKS
jgi:hypothetical protein